MQFFSSSLCLTMTVTEARAGPMYVLDFGRCNFVIWHESCLFLVLKWSNFHLPDCSGYYLQVTFLIIMSLFYRAAFLDVTETFFIFIARFLHPLASHQPGQRGCAAGLSCRATKACLGWPTCPSKPKTCGRSPGSRCSSSSASATDSSARSGWVRNPGDTDSTGSLPGTWGPWKSLRSQRKVKNFTSCEYMWSDPRCHMTWLSSGLFQGHGQ